MAQAKAVAARVEKTMSIKPVEFEAGITRLDPAAVASASTAGGVVTFSVTHPAVDSAGPVTITFEKLEPAVLGGLMRLPRARVTLHLNDLDAETRRRFVGVIDQTFQRGGG